MEKAIFFRELFRETQKKLDAIRQKQTVFNNISITQSNVIVEIGRVKSLTINELAIALERDKSSVSRLIKNMEKSHWLFSEKDPGDRRIRHIKLTDKGIKKYYEIEDSMNHLFGNFIADFSQSEYESLTESLKLLIRSSNKF